MASEAGRAFAAEYAGRPATPVAVVVPAFDESESVGRVVRAVPPGSAAWATEVILVDDGSTDGTERQARTAGALVCRLPVNLGQGQALRLGYRLARDRGAVVIATVDADGQFDPGELPALVGSAGHRGGGLRQRIPAPRSGRDDRPGRGGSG